MLGDYDSKLAIGGWYYTAAFDDLSETQSNGQAVQHRGSSGFYVLGDQVLYRNPVHNDRRLSGFVQAGLGDYRVDRFGAYVGLGLTAAGVIEGCPGDELGLAAHGNRAYSSDRNDGKARGRGQGSSPPGSSTTIWLDSRSGTGWLPRQRRASTELPPS